MPEASKHQSRKSCSNAVRQAFGSILGDEIGSFDLAFARKRSERWLGKQRSKINSSGVSCRG
jgi:hypothetical protein